MRGLLPMTIANIKSFYRNRAALFWTLAFPVIFIVLFGAIFSGGETNFKIGWVDQDHTAASAQLRAGFGQVTLVTLTDVADEPTALDRMRKGDFDAVLVVPAGMGAALQAGNSGGTPIALDLY